MNPELPNNPREELELQVTALLLGELNDADAAAVREVMAKDPELQKFHDDFKQTIDLVREATVTEGAPETEPAEPLTLSDARRKILRVAFTIPPLKPGHRAPRRAANRLIAALAVLALVAVLGSLMLPALSKSKERASAIGMRSNMRQLELAKQMWADENQKPAGTAPTMEELKPYLGGRELPPIAGERYVVGKVGEAVTAEVDAEAAKLTFGRLPARPADSDADTSTVVMSSDGKLGYANNDQMAWQFNGGSESLSALSANALNPRSESSSPTRTFQKTGPTPLPAKGLDIAGSVAGGSLPAPVVVPPTAIVLPNTTSLGVEPENLGQFAHTPTSEGEGIPLADESTLINRSTLAGGATQSAVRRWDTGPNVRGFYDDAYAVTSAENQGKAPAREPAETENIQLKYATASNVAAALDSLSGGRERARVNAINNSVTLSASDSEGAELLAKLDTPTRQGLIESRLIETSMIPPLASGKNGQQRAPEGGGRGGGGAMGGGGLNGRGAAEIQDTWGSYDGTAPGAAQGQAGAQEWFRSARGGEITKSEAAAAEPQADLAVEESLRREVTARQNGAGETFAKANDGLNLEGVYGDRDGQQGGEPAFDWGLGEKPSAPSLGDAPALGRLFRSQSTTSPATPAPSTRPDVALTVDVDSSALAVNGANHFFAGNGGTMQAGDGLSADAFVEADRKSGAQNVPAQPSSGNYTDHLSGISSVAASGKPQDQNGDKAAFQFAVGKEFDFGVNVAHNSSNLGDRPTLGSKLTTKDALQEFERAGEEAPAPDVKVAAKFKEVNDADWVGALEQPSESKANKDAFVSRYALTPAPASGPEVRKGGTSTIVLPSTEAGAVVMDSDQLITSGLRNTVNRDPNLDLSTKERESQVTGQDYPEKKREVGINNRELAEQRVKLTISGSGTSGVPPQSEQRAQQVYAFGGQTTNPAVAQQAMEALFDSQSRKSPETQKRATAEKVELDTPLPRTPSTNAPIPQPEIRTSDNNFSTFSLNVSDVSFKLTAASLEKGQLPEAASIRSEEFINAFDYRDPEPAAGSPIAFAWERARYPFAHNRDLLRFSLKTAAAGRQAGRPLNVVLLLDNSGSMERADRVLIIREALRVLASQLQPQDKLSVITFARTPRLIADGISGDRAAEVAGQVGGLTPEGGTNLEDAMNLAYQTALRHYLANGINRLVVLTDGAANLGNVEPESLKQQVEVNRKQGIALDCFGIGWEGYNDDLLEVLARNGDGRYGFINTPSEAATDFAGQLAGALKVAASDVKVQVEFNAARVTSYRQIGYAKHQLKKEQFRDNTVDAAEIAAQEAGNALYTVEVNPDGSGPLATVRVRYKVPGTTEYREQAWDVPYNGSAVSLDQSSPAMRLASTASAFAEWLVVSPYAGEVTPDALLGSLSGVPEVFGADPRPKKLEWMIRQAKSLTGK
jgi:Mg-chelatase subunit ChlD/anti-sigma factor RsiW